MNKISSAKIEAYMRHWMDLTSLTKLEGCSVLYYYYIAKNRNGELHHYKAERETTKDSFDIWVNEGTIASPIWNWVDAKEVESK